MQVMQESFTRKRTSPGVTIGKRRFVTSVTVPVILYAAAFGLLPVVWALVLMFFEYSPARSGGPILGLGGANPFVGLDHFHEMITGATLQARQFRVSLRNTLIFAFAVLPLNLAITLPLAALIESIHERLKGFFRSVYFLPVVTSSVGVALVWGFMYNPQNGLVNTVLKFFGGTPIAWLTDPRTTFFGISTALWAVIVAYLWQDFGYNMVIFIAALQGIPKEIKEAALIDGANFLQVFRFITIPLLRPALLFVCVMTMLSSFQVFDIIQVMTGGGPNSQTRVLVLDIYENAFRFGRMGWAAATAFVLLLVVALVTTLQMRVLRTDWEY